MIKPTQQCSTIPAAQLAGDPRAHHPAVAHAGIQRPASPRFAKPGRQRRVRRRSPGCDSWKGLIWLGGSQL